MTVKVGGMWELGWSAPITEADLWMYPLRDFAVDEWHMTPISGIANRQVREHASVGEMLSACGDVTVVFVDERADIELRDFTHPDDAMYVFGKANYSPLLSHRKPGDVAVRFDTAATDGLIWPHQAMTVILYDRMVKRGSDRN